MKRSFLLFLGALALTLPSLAMAQSAEEILAKFDDEPTVIEVQSVAMSYAGVDPDRIDGWYTTATVANLAPKRVEYRLRLRNEDRDIEGYDEELNALNQTLGAESQRDIYEIDQLEHNVRVEWDLSELVFNPDILKAAREAGRMAKAREDVLTTVTKLYYERRRAQVDLILNPPGSAADKLRAELRIQELTADLDALTGFWFSGALAEKGRQAY